MSTYTLRMSETFAKTNISLEDKIILIELICNERNISFKEGMDTMEKVAKDSYEGMDYMEKTMKEAYAEALKNS